MLLYLLESQGGTGHEPAFAHGEGIAVKLGL